MRKNARRAFLTQAAALTGFVACGTKVSADVPKKPPPTLEWLMRYSPYIAIGDVERVVHVYHSGGPHGPASLDEPDQKVGTERRGVIEIRVFEWLRPPSGYEGRPLRVMISSYEVAEYRKRYVGKRLIFFLRRALYGDRPPGDYYHGTFVTGMEAMSEPQSIDRLSEVRNLLDRFPEARPYGQ